MNYKTIFRLSVLQFLPSAFSQRLSEKGFALMNTQDMNDPLRVAKRTEVFFNENYTNLRKCSYFELSLLSFQKHSHERMHHVLDTSTGMWNFEIPLMDPCVGTIFYTSFDRHCFVVGPVVFGIGVGVKYAWPD